MLQRLRFSVKRDCIGSDPLEDENACCNRGILLDPFFGGFLILCFENVKACRIEVLRAAGDYQDPILLIFFKLRKMLIHFREFFRRAIARKCLSARREHCHELLQLFGHPSTIPLT